MKVYRTTYSSYNANSSESNFGTRYFESRKTAEKYCQYMLERIVNKVGKENIIDTVDLDNSNTIVCINGDNYTCSVDPIVITDRLEDIDFVREIRSFMMKK